MWKTRWNGSHGSNLGTNGIKNVRSDVSRLEMTSPHFEMAKNILFVFLAHSLNLPRAPTIVLTHTSTPNLNILTHINTLMHIHSLTNNSLSLHSLTFSQSIHVHPCVHLHICTTTLTLIFTSTHLHKHPLSLPHFLTYPHTQTLPHALQPKHTHTHRQAEDTHALQKTWRKRENEARFKYLQR